MALEPFINFGGNCREAVTYYAKVFGCREPEFMTFRDGPEDIGMPLTEADKDLIMYTDLEIAGVRVMFCDTPSGLPFVPGNNISLTIVTKDEDEIRRLFRDLSDGGEVEMELQRTFWSLLYGAVIDRFGIHWQFSHDSGPEIMDGR